MDWEQIYGLLCVVEKASQHPNLTKIRNEALAELQRINDGPKEEPEAEYQPEPSPSEERRV